MDIQSAVIKLIDTLLPPSPFQAISNSAVAQYLAGFNWIFPISEVVAILQAWVVAILTWYLASAALRWAQAIQ